MDRCMKAAPRRLRLCEPVRPFEPTPYESPTAPGTWPSTLPFPVPGPITVNAADAFRRAAA